MSRASCVAGADSLLTLHYRIALSGGAEAGTELISTFGGPPATLKLGSGELAASLERCLVGVACGAPRVFLLEPEQAFGLRRDDLVKRMPRGEFPEGIALAEGGMIEFAAPDGSHCAGVVRALDDQAATVDFNHPLAGRAVRFEVELIALL